MPSVLQHAYPTRPVHRLSAMFPSLVLPALADSILVSTATPLVASTERLFTLTEVVDRAVLTVVKRYGEDGNAFGLGYRLARGGGAVKSAVELECKVPNWGVGFVKQHFASILDAIGDRAMLDLLVEAAVFLRHDNGAMSQIAGVPLHKTLNAVGRDLARRPEPKRVRRERVFYASAVMRNGRGGLPQRHVLNRLVTGTASTPRTAWAHVSGTQARKLALYISTGSDASARRLDARWKPVLAPLRVLLERQRRLPYARLLAAHCGEKEAPHGQVVRSRVAAFVKAVLVRLVPRALLGAPQSRRRILANVSVLVNLPRSDKVAVDVLMKGLKPAAHFPSWLAARAGAPASHQRALQATLARWVEFLFNEVACEVIRAHFYVTEGDPGGVLYFCKRDWQRVANREHRQLRASKLFAVPSAAELDALRRRKSGMARLRLVPKADGGARLVMNLGGVSKGHAVSVNQASRPAFHALKFESASDAIQGLDDIHARLAAFAARARAGGLQGLHVVAMDLRRCFDTIAHDKVLPLVREALKHPEYSVSSHSVSFVDRAMKRARTRTVWHVRPAAEPFRGGSAPPPPTGVRAVRTEHVNRWFVTRQRACELVDDVVARNFAATPFGVARQSTGVPQGSVLSSLLCNLYYGRFDQAVCADVVDKAEDALLRLVDDYCLLTPSQKRAEAFVRAMHADHADWGAVVNAHKTRTSLDSPWVPWCGLLIHGQLGRVRVNFDKTLHASAPVDVTRGGVERAMRASLAVKLHALFVDPLLQTNTECAVNVAQTLVVCARRMHAWARRTGRGASPQAMRSLLSYALALCRARCAKCLRVFALPPRLVRALGGLAFLETLRHRPGLHRGVVDEARRLQSRGPEWSRAAGVDWPEVRAEVRALVRRVRAVAAETGAGGGSE